MSLSLTQVGWTQSTADSLMLQGLEQYHQGNLTGAIAQWQQSLHHRPLPIGHPQPSSEGHQEQDFIEALPSVEVLKYIARAQQQLGQFSEAMASLQQLADYYRTTGETQPLSQILIEQAQLYGELGQPQNAIALLCGKTTPLNCDGDGVLSLVQNHDLTGSSNEIAALGVLGQTYYIQGEYKAAIEVLKVSLALAGANHQETYTVAVSNTLGNVYIGLSQRSIRYAQFARQSQDLEDATRFENNARQYDQNAIDYFTHSLKLAQTQDDAINILRSQLNLVLPRSRTTERQSETSLALLDNARQQLNHLPDTREKAYSAIRLANLFAQIASPETGTPGLSQCVPLRLPSVALLQQAITISQTIQDSVAEAFAIGELGHLYECEADYPTALQLTERAQLLASQPESRYLWEWQAGRILKAQGKIVEAVSAYQNTVNTLQGIQGDIAIANRDLRLDFRDAVEVIYRQLTELQLDQATHRTKQSSQSTVLSALQTLDGLRLAELRNYLGSECDLPSAVAQPIADQAAGLNTTTASISTLILKDRLAVILALPTVSGQIQTLLHDVPLNQAQIRTQVNEFRYLLEQRADRANRYLSQSQQFYDWLIRPFEATLTAHQIQTLIFNHDGILRTIPMAALHSGQQFLVQTYAITNSLSFTRTTTQTIPNQSMQVLAFGLTKSAKVTPTEQFPPLVAVKEEITQIEKTLPGSRVFFDEAFTQKCLQAGLADSSASILHLATHAKFGYDSHETFLVTGEQIQDAETTLTPAVS